MIEMVIFDCDGVLVDSEGLTAEILSADLGQRGLMIAPADCHSLFTGGTLQSAMAEAARRGANLPPDWVSQTNDKIAARLAEGVELLPGLHDLLALLQARGVAIAIASNGPQSKMRASLGPSGLWDHFAGRIHSGHDEARPKPDPHMLLKAAQRASIAPSNCLMIDDNHSGLIAAERAGMRPVGLAADGNKARLAAPGRHIITHLEQVAALL